MRLTLTLIALLSLLTGCSATPLAKPTSPWLTVADVEAHRLFSPFPPVPLIPDGFHGFRVLCGGNLTSEQKRRFVEFHIAVETRVWRESVAGTLEGGVPGCAGQDIGITLHTPTGTIDRFLCLSCRWLYPAELGSRLTPDPFTEIYDDAEAEWLNRFFREFFSCPPGPGCA